MDEERLTVADFFCGAGGFSEGFRQAGFEIRFALDNWQPAIETHKKMHPETEHRLMDIKDIESGDDIDRVVPDVDVIIGGPPCQNFSMSNQAGKADKTEGLNLIECMLRIIAWKREHGGLKYWALENVANTKNHIPSKFTWEDLQLPGDGEDLVIKETPVYNSAYYGVPQTRRRMIVGNFPEPEKRREKEEWKTIKEVFECLHNPLKPEDAPDEIQDPNWDLKVDKDDLTDHFYDTRIEKYRWKRARRLKEDHGFMGKMSFPEEIDRPSRTVMATRSASTREAMLFDAEEEDEESYRLPTVREIASFMSYPITYQFEASTESKKYRLVGNSVPVKLASAIAESIAEEEGIEVPDSFQELPEAEPENDLTGNEREFRTPRRRRDDSKYDRHVPYLKTKAFRPSITNQESDFDEDDVVWTAFLHKGVGKNAGKTNEELETIEDFVERGRSGQVKLDKIGEEKSVSERFQEFREELVDELEEDLPEGQPEKFQKIYCRRSDSDKKGPNEALEITKELIDEHFPKSEFEEVYIDNSDRILDVSDDDVPVRIAVGFYACRYICDVVNE